MLLSILSCLIVVSDTFSSKVSPSASGLVESNQCNAMGFILADLLDCLKADLEGLLGVRYLCTVT